MIRTGTHHFRGIASAAKYYSEQGQFYTPQEIQAKIAAHEIEIGPPAVSPGQQARPDADGRYWIIEADRPAEPRALRSERHSFCEPTPSQLMQDTMRGRK